MLPFRQLVFAITLAFIAVHQLQYLHGNGSALAHPVQQNGTDIAATVAADSRESIPDATSDDQKFNPEAVIKALQALANSTPAQPSSLVTSHGDGGPVDHNAVDSPDASIKTDASVKTSNNKSSADKTKIKAQLLQQPRTRFCAQAANTNHTIDVMSQKMVRDERKRLAKKRTEQIVKSATSSPRNVTDPRSLTDARLLAATPKTVQVVWHVIHDGAAGNLSDSTLASQINTINSDYKAYGFTFNLNATNRVQNANWFRNIQPGGSLQDQMKRTLRRGDAKVLNLYSVDFSNGLLGYSSFPWDAQRYLYNDGVVFQYSSVPGGGETGYDLGKTLTHEVGHWLGLYHVFQGGCSGQGDYVSDTPPQSTATSGCPSGQDSCPGGGVDSIHK